MDLGERCIEMISDTADLSDNEAPRIGNPSEPSSPE
jgi:hypothetical protein